MKSTTRQLLNGFLINLLLAPQSIQAKAPVYHPNPVPAVRPFAVALYVDAQKKINLLVDIPQPGRITITLKDTRQRVLYRESVKRTLDKLRQKFDFEDAQPGTYQFEVSDGKETIRRGIKVVDVPPIDPQRYVTIIHGSQAHL